MSPPSFSSPFSVYVMWSLSFHICVNQDLAFEPFVMSQIVLVGPASSNQIFTEHRGNWTPSKTIVSYPLVTMGTMCILLPCEEKKKLPNILMTVHRHG